MIMWAVAGIAMNRVPDVYKHPHTAQYCSMYITGNRFSKRRELKLLIPVAERKKKEGIKTCSTGKKE